MIQSMTGFGEAQLEEDGHAYHVEARSVNNRYLKASIRLPDDFAFMEMELEQLLRKRVTRGSLTLRVYVRDLSAAAAQEVNVAAIQQYLSQLRAAVAGEAQVSIDLATLAMLPGVCQPHELTEDQREQNAAIVTRLANQALDRLVAMRSVEGQALAADLAARCDEIRVQAQAIRELAPRVVEEYRQRLTARIRQLLADGAALAEQDLLKEVAIYAERSDISEELSRLDSHLAQFTSAMQSREPAGRKLEFIAQELLREANTIGSKAGDSQIARHTIEIKTAVDRIKEQVQNVE